MDKDKYLGWLLHHWDQPLAKVDVVFIRSISDNIPHHIRKNFLLHWLNLLHLYNAGDVACWPFASHAWEISLKDKSIRFLARKIDRWPFPPHTNGGFRSQLTLHDALPLPCQRARNYRDEFVHTNRITKQTTCVSLASCPNVKGRRLKHIWPPIVQSDSRWPSASQSLPMSTCNSWLTDLCISRMTWIWPGVNDRPSDSIYWNPIRALEFLSITKALEMTVWRDTSLWDFDQHFFACLRFTEIGAKAGSLECKTVHPARRWVPLHPEGFFQVCWIWERCGEHPHSRLEDAYSRRDPWLPYMSFTRFLFKRAMLLQDFAVSSACYDHNSMEASALGEDSAMELSFVYSSCR